MGELGGVSRLLGTRPVEVALLLAGTARVSSPDEEVIGPDLRYSLVGTHSFDAKPALGLPAFNPILHVAIPHQREGEGQIPDFFVPHARAGLEASEYDLASLVQVSLSQVAQRVGVRYVLGREQLQ